MSLAHIAVFGEAVEMCHHLLQWMLKSKTDDSTRLALWWPTARLAAKPSARFMSDHL